MTTDAGKQVFHFFFLGAEVGFVVGAAFDFYGNALHNLDTVAGEPDNFLGIIRQQTNLVDAEIHKNLRAGAVVAQIVGEAELSVCLDGIVSLILKGIGAYFIGKADTAPLLTHIDERAASGLLDLTQSRAQLPTAVAAQGAE